MQPDLHISHPLFHAAYVERTAEWTMPNLHYHDAYEIRILEKGDHQYILDDVIYDVHPFDCMMHKPNVLHKSHNTRHFIRIGIYFTTAFLDTYFTKNAQNRLLKCFEYPKITLSKEDYKELRRITLIMLQEDINSETNVIFVYLSYILDILNKNAVLFKAKPKQDDISMVLSYINQNFANIHSIEDIANNFYITKYYLAHKFKEATGATLIQYLNQIRIRNACSMLKNTSMSVTEIGEACGFNSTIYFCNMFKKIEKTTPSEYRRKNDIS